MRDKHPSSMGGLRVQGFVRSLPNFQITADFEVGAGERACLVGPSGAGKTAFLRSIAGLEPIERGKVFLAGQDMTHLPPSARQVGFIFQDLVLFENLSLMENITFGLKVRGWKKSEREEEGKDWLQRVGLIEKLNQPVHTLSGGEKQRVAFVRALIWKPRLLLLDEPFTALDASLRASLTAELLSLQMLWPVPMIFVTHDVMEGKRMATCYLKFSERKVAGRNMQTVREISRVLTLEDISG